MKDQDKRRHVGRHYSKITLKKRERLLTLIDHQNYSIAKAGRKLRIKSSTAKLIVKKFREEGRYFVSKAQRIKIEDNPLIHEIVQTPVQRQDQFEREPAEQGPISTTTELQMLSILQNQASIMQGLALSSPFNYYINTESMVSHWLLIPYEGLTFSYL